MTSFKTLTHFMAQVVFLGFVWIFWAFWPAAAKRFEHSIYPMIEIICYNRAFVSREKQDGSEDRLSAGSNLSDLLRM